MAATIQAINKPTRARALDTSGNNNHGQIYSGRALEFDGVSDYLLCGGTDKCVDIRIDSGSATFACWFKADDVTPEGALIINGNTPGGAEHRLGLSVEGGVVCWNKYDAGGSTYAPFNSSPIESNTWYRAVGVIVDGNQSLYINGVAQTDTGDSPQSYLSGSDDLTIGRTASSTPSNQRHFAGKICDVQIWDAAWTAEDALYDYNNPEQLALNRGGTSLTNSNLKRWYPMNDGHRGQQSYILDASNTGLGDNLFTDAASTFESGTYGWVKYSNNTIENDNGALKVTYVDHSNGAYFYLRSAYSGFSEDLIVGTTYKISFDFKNSGGTCGFLVNTGSVQYIISTTSTVPDFTTYTHYFNATNATTNYLAFTAMSAGEVAWIKNIKVEPINDKNHATTVFYGDDLWDGADGNVTNWVPRDSSTHVSVGGMIKSTAGVSNQGSRIFLKNDADLTTDLTVGRTYRCTLLAGTDTTSGSSIGIYDGANTIWPSVGGSSVIVDNEVTNPGFETAGGGGADIWANWNEVAGSGALANETTNKHNGDDAAELETSGGNKAYIYQTVTGLTADSKYLLTFWSKNANASAAGDVQFKVYDNDNSAILPISGVSATWHSSGNESTSWAQTAVQFTTGDGNTSVNLYFQSPTGDHKVYVDDVVVTKMVSRTIDFTAANTTGAFISHTDARGNNEILSSSSANSDFEDAGQTAPTTVSYQPSGGASSGATIDADNTSSPLTGSKDLKFTNSSGASAAVVFTEGIPMTAGKIYHVEFNYKVGSGDTLKYKIGKTAAHDATNIDSTGGYAANNSLTATSKTAFSQRFTHTDTDAECFLILRCDDGENFQVDDIAVRECETAYFDDITLKEIGTASGWTDADQQLDIPQTALQSYNQLAWWKDYEESGSYTADEYVTITNDNNSYTAETVSCWFITDSDKEQVLVAGLFDCGSYGSIVIGGQSDAGKISIANSNGSTGRAETTTTWNDGKWHHCVGVIIGDGAAGGSGDFFDIYIDGEKQTVATGVGAYRGSDQTLIGGRHLSSVFQYQLSGTITEVSAWDNKFTQAEVNELYNNGKALNAEDHSQYANCLGYWRNNGLSAWTNIKAPGTNNGALTGLNETMLITAGVDGSRDSQGFIMNRQRATNSLNLLRNDSTVESSPYLYMAQNPMYTGSEVTKMSYTMWVKFFRKPSETGQSAFLLESITGNADAGFLVQVDNNNIYSFRFYTDASGTYKHTTDDLDADGGGFDSSEEWVNGKWIHFAGIFEELASDTAIQLYVNGNNVGGSETAYTDPFAMHAAADAHMVIGGDGTGTGGAVFNSDYVGDYIIDDVAIYSDRLTPTEILRNYNAGKRSHR